MVKVDKEFNLKDWEWIAVHFPPSEREAMARVAWLVCCKCTPEEISKRKIDPRIVVPLCGIVLLDEIDISQIKNFKQELSDYVNRIDKYKNRIRKYNMTSELLELRKKLEVEHINEVKIQEYLETKELEIQLEYINKTEMKEDFNGIKKEFINLVITSTNPRKRWLSLFKSLDLGLQFFLLSSLIKHRPPTRDDWRKIFIDLRKGVFLVEYFFMLFRDVSILILIILVSSMVIKVADFFIEFIGNRSLIAFYFIWCAKYLFLFFGGALFLLYTVWFLTSSLFYITRNYYNNTRDMLSIFIHTVVLFYSIKYYSLWVFFGSVIVSIKMTGIIVIILWFFGKFRIRKSFLLDVFTLNGYMLLFFTLSTSYFYWKITLLIFATTLLFSSILWIYAQNLQRKADNPFQDILKHGCLLNLVDLRTKFISQVY